MTRWTMTVVLAAGLALAGCGGGGGGDNQGGSGGTGGTGGTGGSGGTGGTGGVTEGCGNSIVEGSEECDDGNTSNDDDCVEGCKVARCGDSFVNSNPKLPEDLEECDDDNRTNSDACTNECKVAICGDGIVQKDVEFCDDANDIDDDECPNNCEQPKCGDGIVQAHLNETCDDENTDDTDDCPTTCKVSFCGDGFVHESDELCDDGNLDDSDDCPTNCRPSECGDGFTHAEDEECDDGNDIDTDQCLNNCEIAECGDGVVRTGFEFCDDGNDVDTDDCTTLCQVAACGDGHIQTHLGEVCDDGNSDHRDDCPTGPLATHANGGCQPAFCGDEFVHLVDEKCDDGNDLNTDGCLNSCEAPTCGDGFVWRGIEGCDDGNTLNGDGCSSSCQVGAYHVPTAGGTVTIHDSMTETFVTFARPDDTCTAVAGAFPFRTFTISNPHGEAMKVYVTAHWWGDGVLAAYTGLFNSSAHVAGNPAPGCVAANDNYLDTENSQLGSFFMAPGDSLTIVAIGAEPRAIGPFTLELYSETVCGDGVRGGDEECDDGDLDSNDGCSDRCIIESGSTCPAAGGTCTSNLCGDSLVGNGEACDDGNNTAAGGCNANCTAITAGYYCNPAGGCRQITCGDGFRDGTEQCDDGNTTANDGCSATCQVEVTAETETNDTTSTANALTASGFFTGALNGGADVADHFSFTAAAAGDVIRFETFVGSVGGCTAGGTDDDDTVFEILDTNGAVIASDDDSGVNACSRMAFVAPAAGTYYLRVTGKTTASPISYWLQVQ